MEDVAADDFEQFDWKLKPPYHKYVLAVLRSVGWYIVGISIILIYTWPYIQKKWKNWKKKHDEMEYDAKYHKNVDLSTDLLIATQQAREKMQEKYLKERETILKKEEERKERKRQELLRLQNQGSTGHRLNGEQLGTASSSSSSKTKYKPEFNPLMGAGTSGRYIPPKRSCCKKGGCG